MFDLCAGLAPHVPPPGLGAYGGGLAPTKKIFKRSTYYKIIDTYLHTRARQHRRARDSAHFRYPTCLHVLRTTMSLIVRCDTPYLLASAL